MTKIIFFCLVFFFSSTMEMNGSKQHPIVPFTLSTTFKDLVLTLVICHTTLLSNMTTFLQTNRYSIQLVNFIGENRFSFFDKFLGGDITI